jgi:hypothetical protein
MDLLTPTQGKYMLKPVVTGAAITGTARAVGYFYPKMGTALVKNSVKVFGLATITPGWVTFLVTSGGAYVKEVMMPDPRYQIKTWSQYLAAEAKADLIMMGADAAFIVGLQWGKLNNINVWNAAISIPVGGMVGCAGYGKIVKPMFVKKGSARSYNSTSRTPGAMLGMGQTLSTVNDWITKFAESNLETDVQEAETITMESEGWAT